MLADKDGKPVFPNGHVNDGCLPSNQNIIDPDVKELADIMCRSDDAFHRFIGSAYRVGDAYQRHVLEKAFPDIFRAFRQVVAAGKARDEECDRVRAEYRHAVSAVGLKISY